MLWMERTGGGRGMLTRARRRWASAQERRRRRRRLRAEHAEHPWHGLEPLEPRVLLSASWIEQAVLAPPANPTNDTFGISVDVEGDLAVVGAPLNSAKGNAAGAAYIYHRNQSGRWSQKAMLTASDAESLNNFGASVAVDAQTQTVVVGSLGDSSVHMFHKEAGGWVQVEIDGPFNTGFGQSVDIEGRTIVVGASISDVGAYRAGAAYVYHFDGSAWNPQDVLIAPNGDTDDDFGESVALDEGTIVVGASSAGHDLFGSGRAYVYELDTQGTVDPADDTWTYEAELAASDKTNFADFGRSVAVDGDTIVVGAQAHDEANLNGVGSVYIFHRESGVWQQQQQLLPQNPQEDDAFGWSVDIDQGVIVTSALRRFSPDPSAVYVFRFNSQSSNWEQTQQISLNESGDITFARSVAIDGQTILVSELDDNSPSPGVVHVYTYDDPIQPSTVQGVVWADFNGDGKINFGEDGISGVEITLTGTTDAGKSVTRTDTTGAQGLYVFTGLKPGTYTITEAQPADYADAGDSAGKIKTANGTVDAVDNDGVNDQFSGLVLTSGSTALNFNFGEQPVGGDVSADQFAGIGFWLSPWGQDLIRSVNDATNPYKLSDWLATTFPNLYGADAGSHNLTGFTNDQVADFYNNLFFSLWFGGPTHFFQTLADLLVLSTTLSVYVTNASLVGGSAALAESYGFDVTEYGLGASTINVGNFGEYFGVEDNTEHTVMDLLFAIDERAAT